MQKVLFRIYVLSAIAALGSGAVVGLDIFTHNYEFGTAMGVFVCSTVLLFLSGVPYKLLRARCPHCGKIRWLNETICPYCGRKAASH